MAYLAHTAHYQFLGLVMGILGWILTFCSVGINEWRLWYVSDDSVITSGVAWVGVFRACFYSHVISNMAERCRFMAITDSFLPTDIIVTQILIMTAVVMGLFSNVTAGYAMRKVYFGLGKRRSINMAFWSAGTLYMLTATCSYVSLFWNVAAVLNNQTITFPPEYDFPPAPMSQGVGSGVGVGIGAASMIALSGLLFLTYRYPKMAVERKAQASDEPSTHLADSKPRVSVGLRSISEDREESNAKAGEDNPAFELQESP
ncbi:hypothetical protein ACEWY4_014190 [Coilia grayii]|uniref:Claudin-34 n=1 Tax=Coilia grayii TaxID=363190 RepID=A0ABD1JRK4_9TELE